MGPRNRRKSASVSAEAKTGSGDSKSTESAEATEPNSPAKRRRTPKRGDTPFDRFVREQGVSHLRRLTGLRGAANRFAASHLIRAAEGAPVLYITPHPRAADAALIALRGLLGAVSYTHPTLPTNTPG